MNTRLDTIVSYTIFFLLTSAIAALAYNHPAEFFFFLLCTIVFLFLIS